MNKYFLGSLYGYSFFVEAETEQIAKTMGNIFTKICTRPKRTFMQRLVYLFTNK